VVGTKYPKDPCSLFITVACPLQLFEVLWRPLI